MDLIKAIDIAASGMSAERARLNVISMNLANANTTRTASGGPYRKKTVIFETAPISRSFEEELKVSMETEEVYGVRVTGIAPVKGPFRKVYDPSHPDADRQGYVYLPNVNLVQEMVSMLNANRGYEANAAAIRAAKEMALQALDLAR
ncbi:MAG: flagellar basal body rod protein FlgC [Deltaproteobacteria bacterium]|nr:MAG: flagellar basal body rod protein FlgC [Deltaproteobacteria bacterium]RLB86009.1 MAG: flagellar basal body rod protein FlgC [Deltaproteobacteria bacterium]